MSYIVGEEREQGVVLPARLEDYVAPDAPLRVIDAFVDGLDMSETARLDRKIADYLAALDEADAAEPDDAPGAVQAAIAALQARCAEVDRLAAKLEDDGRSMLVEGKENARPMGFGRSAKPPSCNVQTAVDTDTGLILHHEVTDEATDNRMLHPMAGATKQMLERDALTVVADTGYSSGTQATACEADGITACVPANRAINNHGDGTLFDRSAFVYEAGSDSFRCPAGRRLVRRQLHRDGTTVIYGSNDCSGCALKPQCTTAARRCATRHLHEDALNRMNERATPQVMQRRRCAAEHPFGTIKRMMAGGRFLTRNLKGTRTEMALSVLAYNILRAVNIRAATA